jgi:hypothetical protein
MLAEGPLPWGACTQRTLHRETRETVKKRKAIKITHPTRSKA